MEILNYLIEIITSTSSNDQLFQKIGRVEKYIGHNLIFDSKINGVQGIGLTLIENKISSASFLLKEAIPFKKMNDVFSEYHLGYNHYDDLSVINFKLNSLLFINNEENFLL